MKQFIKDIIAFIPRMFRESWISIKWDWAHRTEKNNRYKRRRKRNEIAHIYKERYLKVSGRI